MWWLRVAWCSKNYQWDFQVPNRAAIVRSIKEREARGEHGRLVNSDISDGEERVRAHPRYC